MTFHTARAAGSDLWPYAGLSQSLLSLTPPEPHDLSSHSCAWSVLRGWKETRETGLLGASVLLCMCVLMYRDGRCLCVGGWGLYVTLFVSVYLHISWSLASARTLTGKCILRNRWVTKTVYLLQTRLLHADRVRKSINQAHKGQWTPNGSVSVSDANVIC